MDQLVSDFLADVRLNQVGDSIGQSVVIRRVGTAQLSHVRRHAETSELIPCPSLRAKRSNPGAAARPSGLLAPRMLWPLDCFVARAPRNDGWVAADPIDSVVIGRRLSTHLLTRGSWKFRTFRITDPSSPLANPRYCPSIMCVHAQFNQRRQWPALK